MLLGAINCMITGGRPCGTENKKVTIHNKKTAITKFGESGIKAAKGIDKRVAYKTVLIGASLYCFLAKKSEIHPPVNGPMAPKIKRARP